MPTQPGETDTTELGGAAAPASPLETLRVGEAFADYDILEELGRGGMGAVYRARNRSLGRIVALKVLLPSRCESEENALRFLREAQALAKLDHHNLVTVYHVGVSRELPFIEMQYVDGKPLGELLKQGPLGDGEACRIIEQAAHGLSHAHKKGIVHRDVKPGNILLTSDGVVKVADFGLARAVDVSLQAGETASSASVCGTPQYMAPEQWSGHLPDARTDQYGLGVTFYQLVTGRAPFAGDAPVQMRQHLLEAPPLPHHLNPRVGDGVERIILRLLAKEPRHRYASCDELITELRLLQAPPAEAAVVAATVAPVKAPAPVEGYASTTPRADHGKRSFLIGAATALAVLLAHALGWLEGMELRTLDQRFAWTRGVGGDSSVVVVVVDRESKNRLAPERPLSRERHYGELIARLGEAGARGIGLDLLMTDRASREEDGSLAAMTRMTPAVVHAMNLAVDPAVEAPPQGLEPPERWALDIPAEGLPEARRLNLPVPELCEATPRAGHVALSVDGDGVIRRVPHLLRYRSRVYPSLSLATVMTALGVSRDGVRLAASHIELNPPRGPAIRIPVDSRGQMGINFRWRERALAERPLWQALGSNDDAGVPAGTFKDAVVLVGSKLDGDYDVGSLPAQPSAALVYAHAMAVDTILAQSFVVPVGFAATTVLVGVAGLLAALAGGVLRPALSLPLTLGGIAGYGALVLLAFGGRTRFALPLVAPAAAAAAGYLASTLARYGREEREKEALAGALSRYLSPSVTRRVLGDPEGLKLGGKRKELTVLCAEVHRFGELSERLEPEEIDEFLGAFFAAMSDAVFKHEGTLDQFTGQGVRAFFGDPQPQEDHALRAVRCGLELRGRAADVVRAWAHHGRPTLHVGVGIHTGYVTVGNVGSLKRMEYMVLGRNVELAAQLARAEPGKVVVSARTRALTESAVLYAARPEPDGQPAKTFEALTPV